MQHVLSRLLLASCFLCMTLLLQGQAPTVPTSNLTFPSVDGDRLQIRWTKGNGSRRIVIARAGTPVTASPTDGVDYNTNTNFGSGDEIAPGEFIVYDGTAFGVTVRSLQANTTYHFRVFEYNGSGAATEYLITSFLAGSQATVAAPTVQASNITFSNITGNSMTVTCTRGNGTRRIIVAKSGSPVDANPVDQVLYNWNEFFGRGPQIGTGNYVVYRGTANTINLRSLSPNTTYHFAIYEYNGSSAPIYLLPGASASQTTATTPTTGPTNLEVASQEGNRFRIRWTNGNGNRRLLVVKEGSAVTGVPVDGVQYAADLDFGDGDQLNAGEYVISSSTSSSTEVRNLQPNTTYYIAVFEFNGSASNTFYLTSTVLTGSVSTAVTPSTGASAISFTNVTGNSMRINWTRGNGARRLVVMKAGSAVDFSPTDLSNYGFGNIFGLSTAHLGGGNYAVYRGTGNSVNVTSLTPGVTYHIAIFEYNGSSYPVYLRPGTTANQATLAVPPTTPASNVRVNQIECDRMRILYTRGNGDRRIIVAKAGSAPTSLPVDGQDYTASNSFGDGDDLGTGEFVVYDGTAALQTISNLSIGTNYFFRVYEYYGTGANTLYLTSSFGAVNEQTASVPATNPTDLSFSNVQATQMTLSWTNGSGTARLLVVKANSAVDFVPTDCMAYSTSLSGFGSATYDRGGGNYTVYRGASNSITITNLTPGVDYHFALFEYEGNSRPVYSDTPPRANQSTPVVAPSTQASNLRFDNIGGTASRILWNRGSGSRRLVVMRADGVTRADPADATSYTADSNFGDGDATGLDNFVVYDGTSNQVTVRGLSIGTLYRVEIYEYNGSGSDIRYLRPSLAGSFTTAAKPSLSPSNLLINETSATSVQVSWTNGNGNGRLLVVTPNAAFAGSLTDGTTYASSTTYGQGVTAVGNGFVCYVGTGTVSTVSGLAEGSTYQFTLYEYGGTSSSPAFGTTPVVGSFTTPGPPQVQSSGFMASDILSNSVRLDWTQGSGQRRLILVRRGGDVNATPVDGTDYSPNSNYGAGDQLGTNNYAIYAGAGSSMVLTGLQAGAAYFFRIYEYNFTGASTRYQLTNPTVLSIVTAPLPVECTSFQGHYDKERKANILQWSTAIEENNEGFGIERSSDGHTFEAIGWKEGVGDSDQVSTYEFVDDQLGTSPVHYYRLQQFDFDGAQEQSCGLISIASPLNAATSWKIFPNPLSGAALKLESSTRGTIEVEVFHISGQSVWKGQVEETGTGNGIDLSTLPAATYTVFMQHANGERYQQILIKN
ncbi:MAG: T9SS type A sorting domain-containing protein [Saprospiraceae bacterium]|nr:T9SS type A sorting domain-containing protein [Saprospiraceae bacterium]